MTAGLFSAIALLASLLPSQTWEWDAAPRATAYRIYWTADPARWCEGQYVEVPADCVAGRCQGDATLPDTAFVQIVGVNAYGESPWETAPRGACL